MDSRTSQAVPFDDWERPVIFGGDPTRAPRLNTNPFRNADASSIGEEVVSDVICKVLSLVASPQATTAEAVQMTPIADCALPPRPQSQVPTAESTNNYGPGLFFEKIESHSSVLGQPDSTTFTVFGQNLPLRIQNSLYEKRKLIWRRNRNSYYFNKMLRLQAFCNSQNFKTQRKPTASPCAKSVPAKTFRSVETQTTIGSNQILYKSRRPYMRQRPILTHKNKHPYEETAICPTILQEMPEVPQSAEGQTETAVCSTPSTVFPLTLTNVYSYFEGRAYENAQNNRRLSGLLSEFQLFISLVVVVIVLYWSLAEFSQLVVRWPIWHYLPIWRRPPEQPRRKIDWLIKHILLLFKYK